MNFSDLPIGFIAIGVFAVCVIGIGYNMMAEYGGNYPNNITTYINYSGINTELDSSYGITTSSEETLQGDKVVLEGGEIRSASTVGVLWNMAKIPALIYNVIWTSANRLFGIPQIFTNFIISVIIILGALALIRFYMTGEG